MWIRGPFTMGLAVVLAGVAGWAGGPATAAAVTLESLAAAKGITFGTAVSAPALAGDAGYRERLGAEFSAVTTEDALKWAVAEPAKGVFEWEAADAIVNAAEASGQEVRGHTLVWHSSLPAWLAKETAIEKALEDHITATVGRYQGKVDVWDVVNEPIDNDGTLRRGLWLDNLTADYIAKSFRWAHAADPAAKLYLNEYGAETPGPKADALYALVKSLKADGVPIDGVGFQVHLTGASQATALAAQLRRFADLGVDVAITELDVRIPVPSTVEARAARDAVYGQAVAACLTLPGRCRSITVWGFTDKSSWIRGTYPGWGEATLFDDELDATSAYTTVAAVLAADRPAASAPVGYWPLGDTGGADVSGFGHDAVVRGTTVAGRVPHTTAFAGAGDGSGTEASTSGPVLDTAGSFTVSAWVSLASTSVAGVVASQDGSARSAFYLMYQKTTGRWEFTVPKEEGGTVTWLTARSATAPVLNRWTHLTGVYDAVTGQLRLFVDGAREGIRDGVPAPASTGPFRIGRSFSGGRFDGAISDVRVWNRALSDADVTERAVAWWGFDGVSVDSSAFGRGTSLTSLGTSYTADGKALALDGKGCAEGYGPALHTDRSWTVAARVNLAAVSEHRTVISQSGPLRDAFYLQYHHGYQKWAVLVPSSVDETATTWKQALSTAAPALNTWTHLTAVYDAPEKTLTLYAGGVEQATAVDVVAEPSTGRIHIGCSGSGGRFSGTIDDVRLYASALSAADVTRMAAGTVVR